MRTYTLNKWLAVTLLLLMPGMVDAAGLGRLSVLSSLGQPLHAEIELLAVQKEELATLSVRLAAPDAYRQANLQYSAAAAAVRLSVEKRPDGQPFIRATSVQPINEPFVDLLVELSWASGRLLREYTALVDPPGAAPALSPAPLVAPETRPAPVARSLAAEPPAQRPAADTGSYGPIQRGETLGKIARSVKPDGVTLEQMLVALYRSNPDAFIRKNLNLVKSGRILRVPERQEIAAISPQEAAREYRAQVADWNAYRKRLAEAPAAAPEGGRAAASGRISGRVEEGSAAEPKDVVRLSKGETPGATAKDGKPVAAGERIRNLEEDLVAREKALKEANERVAQLEKTIKDMQRLAEIKSPSLAAAQQQAEAKAGAKPEPVKPEPQPAAEAQPEVKPAPKPEAGKAAPKPQPKAKPAPPPPPEPGLVDLLSDPIYLGLGGVILVLLLYWFMRRRRRRVPEIDEVEPEIVAPTMRPGSSAPVAPPAAAAVAVAAPVAVAAAAPADDVDALDEADVYLSLGRDAQAEAVLKDALAKAPQRGELHLKLLEIYAARKDRAAFGSQAETFNKLTAGKGENWLKVAAMGYAIDPDNPLYAAGKDIVSAAPAAPAELDFNLDVPEHAQKPAAGAAPAPVAPDFNLEVPGDAPAAPREERPAPANTGTIDFSLELPESGPTPSPKATPAQDSDAGLDFKLDIGKLDLDLGEKREAGAGVKDAHWYDVQTKFDLAKAYQEMGDKEGARQALEEVIKEGDPEQQAKARSLLDAVG